MLDTQEVGTVARRAYSYIRFSGKRQEAGASYARQMELAERAAQEEGVELDRTLTLADKGLSGFRGANWKKGNLGKFIDLIDQKIIPTGSVLIIERVNRMSRLPWMKQVELWREILERGITIRTCEPPSRYTRKNMNEIAVGCPVVLFMMLGNLESQQKSEWVRDAYARKKLESRTKEHTPHGTNCPAWIEPRVTPHPKNPARKVTIGYELHPERAEVIRWMFKQAQEGMGTHRILKALQERNIPPFERAKKGRWTLSYVRRILTSREVIGEYQPGGLDEHGNRRRDGEAVPGYYPAVIPTADFDVAQRAMKRRRWGGSGSRGPSTNLFTKLVFKRGSGEQFFCATRSNRGKRYTYLATERVKNVIPYQPFEDAILDAIAKLKPQDVDGRHQADALTAKVDRLLNEVMGLKDRLDSQERKLNDLATDKDFLASLEKTIPQLRRQLRSKGEELRQAQEAANTSARVDTLNETQTIVKFLRRKKGTTEEPDIRRRIKARLPLFVESIWLDVQMVHKRSRFVHVKLYLSGGGEPRYLCFRCGIETATPPWDLEFVDFRTGDVAGNAAKAGIPS
jgi:hypothetical protein